MTKPLADRDFRCRRWVLEDDDFGLARPVDEGHLLEPMISEEAWHSIMDLPDDVAIRTTDSLGQRVERMWNLWGALTADFEKAQQDGQLTLMLDCGERIQAATFTALTGYYREAYSCLRGVVEYSVYGIYMADRPERIAALNNSEFAMPKISSMCNELASRAAMQSLEGNLQKAGCHPLFTRGTDAGGMGLVRVLYADLCGYAHANPRTTNAALWGSNGPVFDYEQLLNVYEYFGDCFILLYFVLSVIGRKCILDIRVSELLNDSRTDFRRSLQKAFAWAGDLDT